MKFLTIFALFMYNAAQSQNDDAFKDVLDVKPDGKLGVYEREWQKYKCTFTYQALGGTKEQWQFVMEKLDEGKLLRCTVTRGATSYLMFQNFTMTITGPKIHLQDYDAVSYLETRLEDSEVKMSKKRKTVYAVTDKFKQRLERLTVTARIGKKKKIHTEL